METKYKRPEGPDVNALSSINVAIDTVDLAGDATSVTPAKDVFVSASILLTAIRVRFPPAHVDRLLTDSYRIRWPRKWIASN